MVAVSRTVMVIVWVLLGFHVGYCTSAARSNSKSRTCIWASLRKRVAGVVKGSDGGDDFRDVAVVGVFAQ